MLMRRYRSNDKIRLHLFWLSLPNKLHSPNTTDLLCYNLFRASILRKRRKFHLT